MAEPKSADMVERVARAICKSRTCEGLNCCQWPANGGRPGDMGLPRLAKRRECPVKFGGYDDAARAAIEAMREPNEAMVRAAYDLRVHDIPLVGCDGDETAIWQAMLCAALKAEG